VDFFLEYDRGTEDLGRLAGKLDGYVELAAASGIATPVLLWLPGPSRETAVRQAIGRPAVPVATASPAVGGTNPAGPVWLPAGQHGPRRRLVDLTSL
jgi:Replication-relaxation